MSRATLFLRISAFLAGCTAKEKASTSETSGSPHTLVFISNEGSGELSVIDAARDSVMDRIGVTSESDHVVTVLDAESGATVARIAVRKRPRDVIFSDDGMRAYVSAESGGNVSVVDAAQYRVLGTIPMTAGAKRSPRRSPPS